MNVNVTTAKVPNTLDAALGTAVRVRRRSMGFSQENLADACGISFQQIQKYENGHNRISFSRLMQIAAALQCKAADLMAGLDAGDDEPLDPDLHHRLQTPGALELLALYQGLTSEERSTLLTFLRTLGAPASGTERAG